MTPEQRKTLDLSSWQVAFNGAEPVRAETIEAFSAAFAPCGFRRQAFYPCYGLAEATLIVSGGFAKQPPVIRHFSAEAISADRVVEAKPKTASHAPWSAVGRPSAIRRIVIADPETLTQCPPERIGEIWVSGPSIAQGYWQQPEATQKIFHAYLKPSGDGPFLRTGDLGFHARRRVVCHRAAQRSDNRAGG